MRDTERSATAVGDAGPPPQQRLEAGNVGARELAIQWRRLIRAATFVAVLTSPVAFVWWYGEADLNLWWSLLVTFLTVIAFRGVVDVALRRFIPWPTLFGQENVKLQEEDVVNRRRAWFWRKMIRRALWIGGIWAFLHYTGFSEYLLTFVQGGGWVYLILFPILFIFNFLILFGPLVFMGISQMRAYEPGDADWGVKLEDVRGQVEAKEEVRRVVSLWQSGEAFEAAGGKRERGLLLLGAPGTGKTMLSKAIATNFNAPFLSMPGSGFAQTFIGMDVVIVRFMAAKAKRLARKWGGQCIVFIDEIDAVGRRRSSLGGASPTGTASPGNFHEHCFFGPFGALTPTEDLILESRAWRERLFEERQPPNPVGYSPLVERLGGIANFVMPGMFGGGGGLALNQLLVVMDGIGDPPFWRRFWTNRINTFLDATYVVPTRLGKVPLRLPRPRPRSEQIFFVGATNVPIEVLDPAMIRPGRMGRHVWFRTPTKRDRLDIFDLYVGKVAHEPDLDTPKRRDELARITNGYSPAMIEQVCSMALTISHHDGRERFGWEDLVEAMTTIESGTAIGIEYVPDETRAVAIHEAGHAVAAHVYLEGTESTRLSIRKRGQSLGHHQALEKEERFSSWRHEEMGKLVWTLGAMAAERVFYGENSTGVGGDVMSGTARAAWMVGACAMAPERVEVNGRYRSPTRARAERDKIMERFEEIGKQIMRRTGSGGPFDQDPLSGVMSDEDKRAMAAQILGQAYFSAHKLIEHNRDAVEHIADVLIERRELHGNEVLELLEEAKLELPEVDLTDEKAWPKL